MGAALPFIGKALVTFFTASGIGFTIARTVLINLALGAITKKLAGKRSDAAPPLNVTLRGTVERRRIILGTRRAGGVVVFYGTSGSANAILWYVVVYAGHQVCAITDVWIDQVRIANADINGGAAAGGAVTAGQFSGKVSIFKHLGTGAQTVDTNIDTAFSEWTSNHRLRGCAYIVVKMERSDPAFPNGPPQSISALIDGAPLYDPRLDSTNGGSGSHRRDDPSTWGTTSAIIRNPALQARWLISGGSVVNDQATRMIMYGLRETDARILDSYTIAAANECDESISGVNAPPSGAQLRYRCDLEASCGEPRRDILDAVLASMAGTAVNEHGQWRIYAGAYDTPTHTFTQDDLYGELQIQDTTPHGERYNAVSATFIDAAKQYVEQTTIFRTDSAYETQDGGERIPRVLDLRGVTDQYQAQRLCEIELRKSRMQRTVQLVGALNLLKVAKWETLNFSHTRYGWSSRIFRCMARQFEFNEDAGRVVITAQREDPGVYADMLTGDYTTGTSATDVFVVDGPEAPTDLTIERFREQLLFRWTLPASYRGPQLWTEVWEYTATTPFASATKIAEVQGNTLLIKNYSTAALFYWIRFKNAAGQVSATFPATNGQSGQPLPNLDELFFDSFDHQDYARHYELLAGSPTVTYPQNGETGGVVLRVQGAGAFLWKRNITFDPNAIYIMTIGVKMVTAPSVSTEDLFYCGVFGVTADGVTLRNTAGANSVNSQHMFVADNFDFGTIGTGVRTIFRGYLSGFNTTTNIPSNNIDNPSHMYDAGITYMRPFIGLNRNAGDGIMEVDFIKIDKVTLIAGIGPDAASDTSVTSDPADGNIVYSATTQPAIEAGGLNASTSYTAATVANAGAGIKAVVTWTGQATISNTTSGVAVGEARLSVKVVINGSTVDERWLVLEPYTATYGLFAGGDAYEVPAGQNITVTLGVGRAFSTGGASPAQTITWRSASLSLTPLKR
jgi:hypothetical protein